MAFACCRSELPGLEVDEGLMELGVRVHHEGAIFRDRLAQRPTGNEDGSRPLAIGPGAHALEAHHRARPEHCELVRRDRLCRLTLTDPDRALEDIQER